MRAKVKFVTRRELMVEGGLTSMMYGHAERRTCTWAVTYDDKEISIDEDEIRRVFNQKRITTQLIDKLSDSLHNVYVDYREDGDGILWLDGGLDKYVK